MRDNLFEGRHDMDSEEIARKLVVLRGDRSRQEVSKALGISLSALAMYENGDRIPRDETKKRIASFYGKSVEEIFFT